MNRWRSIRILIPLIAMLILSISLGVAYIATRSIAHERITEFSIGKVRDRLNLVQSTLEQYFELDLEDHVQQLLSNFSSEPDLKSLLVATDSGVVIASARYSDVGHHWMDIGPTIDPILAARASETHSVITILDPGHEYIDGYTRICGRFAQKFLRPKRCGFVFYRLNLAYHLELADKQSYEQNMVIGVSGIVGALLLLVMLSRLVSRPAVAIGRALLAFTTGNRDVRVGERGGSELIQIARLVNQMFMQIQTGERLLQDKEERLRSLFGSISDAIVTIDAHGIIESVNPATESMFGYSAAEMVGRNLNMLMSELHRSHHDGYLERYHRTGETAIIGIGREVEAQSKDGENFPVRLSVSEFQVRGSQYFTGLIQDISDRKRLEEELQRSNEALRAANVQLYEHAITDGLTTLFNRRHFDLEYDKEVRRACRSLAPLSIMICDIDHFKSYNDRLGHHQGDECLKAIAQEIRDHFRRSGELVARYGGEEFVVIFPGADEIQASRSAESLRLAIWRNEMPHPASSTADRITVSIGVATYHPHDGDADDIQGAVLFERADQALYRAKKNGRNCVVTAPRALAARRRQAPDT